MVIIKKLQWVQIMSKVVFAFIYFSFCLHLTTISVELGFLWDFVHLSLKTCSLYHEKLFIQVFFLPASLGSAFPTLVIVVPLDRGVSQLSR